MFILFCFLAGNWEVMIFFLYHEHGIPCVEPCSRTLKKAVIPLNFKKSCHSIELKASKNVEHLRLQTHHQRLENLGRDNPCAGRWSFIGSLKLPFIRVENRGYKSLRALIFQILFLLTPVYTTVITSFNFSF